MFDMTAVGSNELVVELEAASAIRTFSAVVFSENFLPLYILPATFLLWLMLQTVPI